MGKVCYSMSMSLDGYVEDPDGSIGFSNPDHGVHRLANAHARDVAAFLFGRRLYDVMEEYWTTAAGLSDLPDVAAEFADLKLVEQRGFDSGTLFLRYQV